MRPRPATGVAVLLAVGTVALSACGTISTTPTTPTASATAPSTRPPPPRTPAHPPRPRRRSGPRVGATQHVPAPGTTLIVTVTSLIDPLRGSGAKVPHGTRAVGVLVSVRNGGQGGYDSSATGDFSLLSAAGPAAPVFVPEGPCQTPLQDFMNAISAGELRTGCVAFAVPSGQAPSTVRFSPDGGATGHRLSWVVASR